MARTPARSSRRPSDFLPMTLGECRERGWESLDVIFVTGDAYVDHPAFGASLLGRWLEANDFRVGVIARPDVEAGDLERLGEPDLFFAISAGAVDSMLSNYTAQKRRRSNDAYAPGGKAGGRPDRATIVYANTIRRLFGRDVPILAGGVEASLRRFAHYDFWSDRVRRSILLDAPVDAIVYGMGERPLLEIARGLRASKIPDPSARIEIFARVAQRVPGVVHRSPASRPAPSGCRALPSFEAVRDDPASQVKAFRDEEEWRENGVYQDCAGKRVIANPPSAPLSVDEMDRLYDLPFKRLAHPSYEERIPALEQVQFSVTSHRGCYGGCAFCGISAHQGKAVQSRSRASVLSEVRRLTKHPDFRGTIRDIGGPTANMWNSRCGPERSCRRPSCLAPRRCPHLQDDQQGYRELLDAARRIPGVRHLFVTTGVRMDLVMECPELLEALASRYTSGHMKVAPEHVSPRVLRRMRKPDGSLFPGFLKAFRDASRHAGREQYVLPYFIAAHPGSRIEDMIEVALFMKRNNLRVEQCQIFTPVPGTASCVMYATSIDPYAGDRVFVERDARRRDVQKALILFRRPEQRRLVEEALHLAGREDLTPKLLGGGHMTPRRRPAGRRSRR